VPLRGLWLNSARIFALGARSSGISLIRAGVFTPLVFKSVGKAGSVGSAELLVSPLPRTPLRAPSIGCKGGVMSGGEIRREVVSRAPPTAPVSQSRELGSELRARNESVWAPPVASGVPMDVRGSGPAAGFAIGGATLMAAESGVVICGAAGSGVVAWMLLEAEPGV
jgi:hypothetical protein